MRAFLALGLDPRIKFKQRAKLLDFAREVKHLVFDGSLEVGVSNAFPFIPSIVGLKAPRFLITINMRYNRIFYKILLFFVF